MYFICLSRLLLTWLRARLHELTFERVLDTRVFYCGSYFDALVDFSLDLPFWPSKLIWSYGIPSKTSKRSNSWWPISTW